MGQHELYYLDAMTKDEEYRVTSFSYTYENLISDLGRWMKEQTITFPELEYASIFRSSDDEPVADLVNEDGVVILVPREPDRRLTHRVVLLLRRIRNRV